MNDSNEENDQQLRSILSYIVENHQVNLLDDNESFIPTFLSTITVTSDLNPTDFEKVRQQDEFEYFIRYFKTFISRAL